jgi:protein-tyrosine phosphatase/ADP-ribosylglycohydrolase
MFWNERNGPEQPQTPLPNTYWVEPGRLLAGEYPGSMSHPEAMERVQALLLAGITSFIDLTEEGELPEYDHLLPELTEQRIRYRRLPVLDHSVPDSPAHMTQIVDAIEAELVAGRCVYVHCHFGIGRTGMAIGCHLIRGGLSNQAALDHLQTLWRQSARSRRWPSVPETGAQVDFVRQWRDVSHASAGETTLQARYEGALIGLALGDALGALVSTHGFDAATLSGAKHGSGGLHDASLRTGAHTAMTGAVAESLLAAGKHDATDQMQRYLQWTRAANDEPIPAELRRALSAWQWTKKPNAGSHDPKNLDSHSLPRTLAVALFLRRDAECAIDLAADVSRTTQQAPIVLDLCRVWAGQLIDALSGVAKAELNACNGPAMQRVRQRSLKSPVQGVLTRYDAAGEDMSNALRVTQVAIRSFATTNAFRDALLHVATAHRTPPAAAALCGALCGAHYGVDAIPLEWRRRITADAALRSLANHLLN